MRPEYEKLEDRQNQGIVAAEICQSWDVDIFPLAKYAAADFLILVPTTELCLGELKVRQGCYGTYPTLMISQKKLDDVVRAAETLKMPLFLFVQWLDCIVWRRICVGDIPTFGLTKRGRTDRKDAADIEMVYEIPSNTFHPLASVPI